MNNQIDQACPIRQKGTFSLATNFIETNNDTSIFCGLSVFDYSNVCLTIDTGAMSSIVKAGVIRKGTKVIRDCTEFRGLIKGHHAKAIAKIHLIINGINLEHNFYIIRDDINLRNHGILGLDFLKTYNAKINYLKNEIKFQFPVSAKLMKKENKYTDTENRN